MNSGVYKLLLTIVLLLQVSERAGHIIEYDKFYIHELDDLVDIRNDYITWFQRQMFPSVSLLVMIGCLIVSFCTLALSSLIIIISDVSLAMRLLLPDGIGYVLRVTL